MLAVYAPPRGQKSFGQRSRPSSRPNSRHVTGDARQRVPVARKFHAEDLTHVPQFLKAATLVRDTALQRGVPALTGHAVEARIGDHLRAMDESEVLNSLRTGQVIEVNDGGQDRSGRQRNDCRLLVRDDKGVCVVYSVKEHRVVTCWWNDPSDSHSTLDMSNYQRIRAGGDPASRRNADALKQILARGYNRARMT